MLIWIYFILYYFNKDHIYNLNVFFISISIIIIIMNNPLIKNMKL